ncbi:MAG: hypothetical protein NTW03_11705 [Verrucomicrobia bacterium]|nr:hypothetical protein [Verrucomicrobiota bacterium]
MSPLGIAIVAGVGLLLVWVLIDRVLIPFWATLWAAKAVEKIAKIKANHDPYALENPKHGTVVDSADYLRFRSAKGESWELKWSEVEEVHAFKRDLITTDLICLAFKKEGKEEYYQIHEEMAGYHDLFEALPRRLVKFTYAWFFGVAHPAFETNHQVIWKRAPN